MAEEPDEDVTGDTSSITLTPSPLKVKLDVLIDYIRSFAHKWEFLGIKLGQEAAVKDLRTKESDSESKCLIVLEKWLEADDNVTWGHLVKSLKSIGLENVAKQIAKVSYHLPIMHAVAS